jgi:hypothetical protein
LISWHNPSFHGLSTLIKTRCNGKYVVKLGSMTFSGISLS